MNFLSEEEEEENARRSAALKRVNLVPDNAHQIENLHKDKTAPAKPVEALSAFFGTQKKEEEEDEEGKVIPPTPVIGGY